MKKIGTFLFVAFGVAACTVPPPKEKPIETIRGPVPVRAVSPMTEALACLRRNMPEGIDLRLAVFGLPDKTGVVDYDGPGAYVTQGAELMMVTALAKAGVRQVNRTATNVAEWELKQALEKRLGEGRAVRVNGTAYPFRPVRLGNLLGSTHTIYGGITELDFDIVSDGAELSVAGIGGKARGYYISLGLDIIVADTRTTEIVLARSYRKQLWGQELEANLFRFWDINPGGNGGDDIGDFGIELFDARIGRQQNEPVHASIRWVVEQAAYDIVRDLAGIGNVCDELVPEYSRSAPLMLSVNDTVPPVAARRKEPIPAEELVPEEAEAVAPSAGPTALSPGEEPSGPRAVRLPDGRVLPVQEP